CSFLLDSYNNEIEAIKMQFDSVLEGHSAVTVIAGDIGIGKTALVKTVLSDLSKLNGACVYGKFEQYKDKSPYIPIIQIIEQITNHMLTLPEEKLDRIRKKLIKELGRDSALITSIVPQAQRIMSNTRKIKDSDYQKLKIRMEKAFQTFITIAAQELYPLIIGIDDIQWADIASWNIIESINDPLSENDLYMILAYRNNLEKYRTKVKSMLDKLSGKRYLLEINLESLTTEEVKTMLREVFSGDFENTGKLVSLIYRKTAGNPLYIKQMLNLLLENKAIYHNPKIKKWCLDSRKAKEVNLPDTIADIINRKMDSLSPEVKGLLEIASCIGSRFDLELMEKITNNKFKRLKENLEVLCRVGLIVKVFEHQGTDDTGKFEFFHDRVYQNVYEHIEPDRKEQLHFNIAIELLNHPDKIYIEENILSITAHLLKCKNVIKREGVGDRLIIDLYFAGIKAKRSAAFEHALKLFGLGEELLGNSCWTRDYDNTLKIKLELTECAYICGRYEAAKAYFEEMLEHAADEEDLAEIKKRYMILNSYTGNQDRVIDLGIQALKHLGFNINTKMLPLQIVKEILYGKVLFRSSRLETIKNAPIVTDKRVTNALEILTIMVASANMKDKNLFVLIVLKIGNLSAKYGNSLYSPLAYAAYSLVLGTVMGNFKKAKKLKDISLNLAELFDDDLFGTATYFCIGTFVAHWTSPAKESLNYLQRALDCGIRSGDYLYCGYTLIMMTEMKYLTGEPLDELEKFLKLHEKYVQKMNNDILLRSFAMFKDHINMLAVPDFSFEDRLIEDQEIEMLDTNESMIYSLLKIQRMYLAGKIEDAYHLAQNSIKYLDLVMGSITEVEFVFYFLLVSLERMKIRNESSYWQIKKACGKYRNKLKKWAEMSPENHWGKHLLTEALLAGLNNQQQDAARLYDEAIEHAKVNKNLLLEALGNYLAANYFSSNRKIAKVYTQDACWLFSQWGAVNIAERIEKLYQIEDDDAAREVSAASDGDEMPENSGQDNIKLFEERVKDHQRELETLTLEDAHKYFLDTICAEVGADYCGILLEEGDLLKLEYVRLNGQAAVKFPVGIDPEQVEFLPKKIIRYAGRTFEEVIIEAKPIDGPFANDDYIKKRPSISIICLPLKYNEIFTGLIYLESRNNNRFNSLTVEHIKHQSFYL
ncbi:MAG: AAA family ATPase, partial [Clostridia bacterium]|nr:AAA family ATPase [Clostridia bacterium]